MTYSLAANLNALFSSNAFLRLNINQALFVLPLQIAEVISWDCKPKEKRTVPSTEMRITQFSDHHHRNHGNA